jgi:hypothetical protein
MPMSSGTHGRICADTPMSALTHRSVRADASVLSPGNFITDATVCPSHERPNGYRPSVRASVRPSVHYRPRDNPALPCLYPVRD